MRETMSPNGTRYTTQPMIEYNANSTTETAFQDDFFSAGDLFRAVWHRLWVVLLVAVLLVGTAVGFSLYQTPVYESSIKILVGQDQGITGTPSDVLGLQQITQTMAEVAYSRTVADAVISELDLRITEEDFLENMSVQQLNETQVIEVSYTDSDPEKARLVADTIGKVFSEQISEVSSSANAITATSWEQAVTPEKPVSPNPVRSGLLALVMGLMLGVGLALLLEHLDDRWRSPEEAEQICGVPTLGVIREFKLPKRAKKESEG